MEYVASAKQRNRKRDRADKLKLRMGLVASEVRSAMTEEQEVSLKQSSTLNIALYTMLIWLIPSPLGY
jgi:hypothetical protein